MPTRPPDPHPLLRGSPPSMIASVELHRCSFGPLAFDRPSSVRCTCSSSARMAVHLLARPSVTISRGVACESKGYSGASGVEGGGW
eukprot:15470482-Alexandrium_andersonii.AAC.1